MTRQRKTNKFSYKIIFVPLLFILVLSMTGCNIKPVLQADDSQATEEGIKRVVDANNKFAFELYDQLNNQPGNLFLSPYNISSALAMTYEGARNKTADQIQNVFHFPQDNLTLRSSFAKIYNLINKKNKKYKLQTANALWAQKDYIFLDKYLNIVEKYYGGETTNLDFVNNTEKSRQTINNWIEKQTNNKIKDLIPQGGIDKITRLVLTNAIYFKGDWLNKFNKKHTQNKKFKITPQEIVEVDMMKLKDEDIKFNYMENEQLQMLELPYKEEELSMFILLPKKDNLNSLENYLTASKISEWQKILDKHRVDISLPKFTFESKLSLAETLKKMGMSLAFSWPGADFSGMDGSENLFIDKVIHQAFVEVNEKGTEAAAATGVFVGFQSAIPNEPSYKIFNADHPFIFMIQENETGSILFLGRVNDPR